MLFRSCPKFVPSHPKIVYKLLQVVLQVLSMQFLLSFLKNPFLKSQNCPGLLETLPGVANDDNGRDNIIIKIQIIRGK